MVTLKGLKAGANIISVRTLARVSQLTICGYIFFTYGCGKLAGPETKVVSQRSDAVVVDDSKSEFKTGYWTTFQGTMKVSYSEFDENFVVVDGDMLVPRDQISSDENGLNLTAFGIKEKMDNFWPGGVVKYKNLIPKNDSVYALFSQAIKHWQEKTRVKWVEALRPDDIYVTVEKRDLAFAAGQASVGRFTDNRNNFMYLTERADIGTVIHEMGHVLGLKHEHQRPDRDKYVIFHEKNMDPRLALNFNKLSLGDSYQNLTDAMDLKSVMMYGSCAGLAAGIRCKPSKFYPDFILKNIDGELVKQQYGWVFENPKYPYMITKSNELSPGDIEGANTLAALVKTDPVADTPEEEKPEQPEIPQNPVAGPSVQPTPPPVEVEADERLVRLSPGPRNGSIPVRCLADEYLSWVGTGNQESDAYVNEVHCRKIPANVTFNGNRYRQTLGTSRYFYNAASSENGQASQDFKCNNGSYISYFLVSAWNNNLRQFMYISNTSEGLDFALSMALCSQVIYNSPDVSEEEHFVDLKTASADNKEQCKGKYLSGFRITNSGDRQVTGFFCRGEKSDTSQPSPAQEDTYVRDRDHLNESVRGGVLLNNFAYAHGWRTDKHLRMMGDVNGDGKDDVVAINDFATNVLLSEGTSLSASEIWRNDFSTSQGWLVSEHERLLGDVDGDNKDDLVLLNGNGVSVSRSSGSSFLPANEWSNGFRRDQGWSVERHVRILGDVNGDGKKDLIGFGDSSVVVSISTGSSFAAAKDWLSGYGFSQGWRKDRHVRLTADVNGDGREDLILINKAATYVALSDGTKFLSPQKWADDYSIKQGWSVADHVRTLGDVDGDGKADLILIKDEGVNVAFSTGSNFLPPVLWVAGFDAGLGWNNVNHVRVTGDLNGDGFADLIGFGDSKVFTTY